MKKPQNKLLTTLMWFFLYIPVVWLAVLLASNYQSEVSILELLPELTKALEHPLKLSTNGYTLDFVLVFSLIYAIAIAAYYSAYSKRRMGEEHGSASWANPKAICKQFSQNKITDRLFTKHVRLGMDGYKHNRNLNTLVIGGSGAGKTRGYALPNIMQCNSSFVITDPKAEILRTVGNLLVKEGYKIKVLDLINFEKSNHYNPFNYIQDEKDGATRF